MTTSTFDWKAAYANPPQFDQIEDVYDEWAVSIAEKEHTKAMTTTFKAIQNLNGHVARRKEQEFLDLALDTNRLLLNRRGV